MRIQAVATTAPIWTPEKPYHSISDRPGWRTSSEAHYSDVVVQREPADGKNLADFDHDVAEQEQLYFSPADGRLLDLAPPYQEQAHHNGDAAQEYRAQVAEMTSAA